MAETALADTLLLNVAPSEYERMIQNVAHSLLHSDAGHDNGYALAALYLELCRRRDSDAATDITQSLDYVHTLPPVLVFLCRTIQAFHGDSLRLRSLVHFCNQHLILLNKLVSACQAILIKEIAIRAETEHSDPSLDDEVSTVSSEFVLSVLHSLDSNDTLYEMSDDSFHTLTALECLSFLKILVQQLPQYCAKFKPRWTIILIEIVRFDSEKYSTLSKEVVLGLISAAKTQHKETGSQADESERKLIHPILWRQIFNLTNCSSIQPELFLVNTGLALWLRVLSFNENAWLRQNRFTAESYWQKIQFILANGSSEQRKFSLAILMRSIISCEVDVDLPMFQFQKSNSKAYHTQYSRFTTLFETIVLARYLNQVQDCLPDLTALASSASLVHPSWIMVLLHAGLSHGMQDSVRKVIGSWTVHHAAPIISPSFKPGLDFLEFSFLPWASIGSHFSTTIEPHSPNAPKCSFGESLSRFLTETVTSAGRDAQNSRLVGSALRFIASKGGRMFSFARAYILEGIINGLRESNLMYLTKCDASSLREIGQQQSFQEIVRDLMILQCHTICIRGLPANLQSNQYIASVIEAHKALRLRPLSSESEISGGEVRFVQTSQGQGEHEDTLSSAPYDEAILENYSIRQLAMSIQVSETRCLSGNGLFMACNFLYNSFENKNDTELAPGDVDYMLKAIWAEANRRDCPRFIMMSLPRIIFHRKCIGLLQRDREIALTLSELGRNLWHMSKTRIYIFAPVADALRRVFLDVQIDATPFADFFLDYANNPPSTGAEFQLEQVMSTKLTTYIPDRDYTYYYGKPESKGHACVFDTLNKLPPGEPWNESFQRILDQIVDRWTKQKSPIPVFTHWKTTAQLQVMLMIFERLTVTFSPTEVKQYVSKLSSILAIEPLPRYRFLLEWTIARIHYHAPVGRQGVIDTLSEMDISNPKFTVSMIKIALMVVCLPGTGQKLGSRFMAELVSLAASQKIVIRHEAHWTIPLLWNHAQNQEWDSLTGNIAFSRLNRHIRSLEAYKTPPVTRIFERFDPLKDHTLSNLLRGQYLMIEPSEVPKISQEDLVAVHQDASQQCKRTMELMPLGAHESERYNDTGQDIEYKELPRYHGNAAAMLQTKSSTWQNEAMGKEIYETGNETNRESNSVIVIASLIDSPYNLGGISRVSEIFGVKTLKVRSLNVAKTKDFMSVSVSSHMWLHMEELDTDAVAGYLNECKLEGYTIVGMEQTDNSQVLGTRDCQLPVKMALVLGSEKEGIPASLLSEMDCCVEVRQMGVTRSMNVQTALSVGLFEYQRQHQLGQGL